MLQWKQQKVKYSPSVKDINIRKIGGSSMKKSLLSFLFLFAITICTISATGCSNQSDLSVESDSEAGIESTDYEVSHTDSSRLYVSKSEFLDNIVYGECSHSARDLYEIEYLVDTSKVYDVTMEVWQRGRRSPIVSGKLSVGTPCSITMNLPKEAVQYDAVVTVAYPMELVTAGETMDFSVAVKLGNGDTFIGQCSIVAAHDMYLKRDMFFFERFEPCCGITVSFDSSSEEFASGYSTSEIRSIKDELVHYVCSCCTNYDSLVRDELSAEMAGMIAPTRYVDCQTTVKDLDSGDTVETLSSNQYIQLTMDLPNSAFADKNHYDLFVDYDSTAIEGYWRAFINLVNRDTDTIYTSEISLPVSNDAKFRVGPILSDDHKVVVLSDQYFMMMEDEIRVFLNTGFIGEPSSVGPNGTKWIEHDKYIYFYSNMSPINQ